jgi:hypothetical protein
VKCLHWCVDDPASIQDTEDAFKVALRRIRDQLLGRIMVFLDATDTAGYVTPL